MIWKIRASMLSLDRPLIMGILNVTPDSFYDGGRFIDPDKALAHAIRLFAEGADLIDVGAESSRPGSEAISEEEEWGRLELILKMILKTLHLPISIDTTKSGVARRALERGAHIVNDASGLKDDPLMADAVKEFGAGLVVMHRRGTPKTMQAMAEYGDVMAEVSEELSQSLEIAEARGITREQIAVDPGLGFAKTAAQSLEMLDRIGELKSFVRPILIGPSRKSFIGEVTKQKPEQRLYGTIAACVMGFERGAHIFRVHDAWAAKEALLVAEAIQKHTTELGPSAAVPGLDELGAWLLGSGA